MKRSVLAVLLLVFAVLVISGCGLYKQYTIGTHVEQSGNIIYLSAELWAYTDSGIVSTKPMWNVSWGDGNTSKTEDAQLITGRNWSSTDPLALVRWTHVYQQPGDYTITISANNAESVLVSVHVADNTLTPPLPPK